MAWTPGARSRQAEDQPAVILAPEERPRAGPEPSLECHEEPDSAGLYRRETTVVHDLVVADWQHHR